ncbi:carbohydrate sulfotransferase 4-like [Mya arenaria]|uniref:carbohydrate sulfotransferase 4-like n=1 Tax=Mya arenaria TaxID=6604 RepID=UPI0022E5EEB8|nr:carbohydrate sulfotransferase 4-like [Mya arenaria]
MRMRKLRLLLVAVLCTPPLVLLIISDAAVSSFNMTLKRTGFDDLRVHTSRDARSPETYDLLVNAYQNGGSRFTADLFGFRPDAFYFYEPLWRFSEQEYFRSPSTVCSILNNTCRELGLTAVNRARDLEDMRQLVGEVPRNSTVGDLMTEVFADIYRCDFSRISSLVQQQVTDNLKFAGPSWRRYADCRYSKRHPRDICLPMQALYCSNFRHLVVKTLRITTDSLAPLLDRKPDLKVIQLFRNPFAIMNSRLESTFQLIVSDFVEMGESLCRKMEIDYQGSIDLIKKHPDRVKMVFYDDLKRNVSGKVQSLYSFVGMEQRPEEARALDVVIPNEGDLNSKSIEDLRKKDNTQWWRVRIDFKLYREIFQRCTNVVKIFRLTDFKTEEDLRNLNIPDMHLPDMFKI